MYDDHVDEMKFNFQRIKSALQIPVLVVTLEIIIIIFLLIALIIKWIKYGFVKILNYHTPFYYISCIVSFIISLIGYIFLFDGPPNLFFFHYSESFNESNKKFMKKYKCLICIWFFDISINILFLAFIKKVMIF